MRAAGAAAPGGVWEQARNAAGDTVERNHLALERLPGLGLELRIRLRRKNPAGTEPADALATQRRPARVSAGVPAARRGGQRVGVSSPGLTFLLSAPRVVPSTQQRSIK